MEHLRERIRSTVGTAFFLDHARPVEWISLLSLAGWLQFLLSTPDVFAQPRYAAFAALSPGAWAALIAVVLVAQLGAMRPHRHSPTVRFLAMMAGAGIWAVIAMFWWSTGTAPIAARTNTVLALSVFGTAVYLGVVRRA